MIESADKGIEDKSCFELLAERGSLASRMAEVDAQLMRKIDAFLMKVNLEMGSRDVLELRRGMSFEFFGQNQIKINCERRTLGIMQELMAKGIKIIDAANHMEVIVSMEMLD